jgi:hypothetical protein
MLYLDEYWFNLFYRWLYRLILTIDANFRLKNKERFVRNDPALGDGWGCWVRDSPYHEYISLYGHQEEVSFFFVLITLNFNSNYSSLICAIRIFTLSTMQTQSSPRVIARLVLVPCFARGMHWFGKMAWVTCRKVNGALMIRYGPVVIKRNPFQLCEYGLHCFFLPPQYCFHSPRFLVRHRLSVVTKSPETPPPTPGFHAAS